MDFYRKSGNHPLIQAYNEELGIWDDRAAQLEGFIEAVMKDEKPPQPKYEVAEIIVEDLTPLGQSKQHGVRIFCELVNKHELDAWIVRWGPTVLGGSWDLKIPCSVHYYRTEQGILTSAGGGYRVIKNLPVLVTDGEWAEMLEGRLPACLQLE